ncbi:hypothetical protein BC830DRAFT_65402 [Chytriomyces sp. MP71]|nr:hypothetical protein BC830DRAFT_65402 [Chytriomyces sp. MP71]
MMPEDSNGQAEEFPADSATFKTVSKAQKLAKFVRSAFGVQCATAKDAQRLITDGRVTVNGSSATKPMHKLDVGDRVSLTALSAAVKSPTTSTARLAQTLGVKCHLENTHWTVLWKPSGVSISGSGPGSRSLQCLIRPGWACVSSLDTATAGLVVCAKNTEAEARLRKLFAEGLVTETWTVLCSGNIGSLRSINIGDTFDIDHDVEGAARVVEFARLLLLTP